MHTYHLQDEFTDASAERGLLAALAGHPQLYDELCNVLIPDLFVSTQDTWQPLVVAMETTQCPYVPTDWLPAPDPHTTAQRLVDLHQRRLLAAIQERLAQALFDETTPATDIVTLLEEEALRVQAALRTTTAQVACNGPSALLPQVLADAEARRLQRERRARPCWVSPRGWRSSIACWVASPRDCTCSLARPAWAKRPWRCRSPRQRRRTSRWWS